MRASGSQCYANVFDIHRNSTHDGPGIRTTVFLSGCPLRCRWCHNPESQQKEPGVWWFGLNCIHCLRCVDACPEQALTDSGEGIVIDRSRCIGCQACAAVCPARGMQSLGERRELSELLAEVELDRVWFDASGGGVTLSGGEPCNQPEFALKFFAGCRQMGLHTALDTCGEVAPEVFAQILDHVNLVMYDIKHSDEAIHRELTGVGLTTIHVNLREAARRAMRGDLRLWIRTPLVPGAAAEPSVLDAIGRFLRTELNGAVERWELCAFNPSCGSKYRRLGMAWDYSDLGLQTESETASLLTVARNAIGRTDVVHLQGIRRSSARSNGSR
jgi:pyruvate formate lyase activating enzyme